MTRRDALLALLGQVEAGEWPVDFLAVDHGFQNITTATFYKAFSGSLDAAKALHEAALPGWRWNLWAVGGATVWPDSYKLGRVKAVDNPIPARAWLIAIIRALIEDAGE
jgi:hypothetical protein